MGCPVDAAAGAVRTPAGWYDDPAGASRTYRWWDGTGWTSWLSGDPAAPEPAAPTAEPAPVEPVEPVELVEPGGTANGEQLPARVRPPGYERGRRSTTFVPSGRTTAAPSGLPVAPAEGDAAGSGAGRSVRVMGVVAALAAVVVVAGVIVLGNRAPTSPIALPPAAPLSSAPETTAPSASASAGSAATYDSASGRLSIGTFETDLPRAPYLISNALAPRPLLANGVEADAVVQAKYDGSHDWDASLVVGELDPSLVVAGDASATADRVLNAWVKAGFDGVKVSKGTFTRKKVTNPNTKQVVIMQGRLGYSVPKVKSRYDQVSLLVIEMSDGRWIGWVSSRPQTASASVKAALQTSIDTLRT